MKLTSIEEAVLDLIKQDKAYENYFFRKVSDVKWFYPLKKMGYFSPKNVPLPKSAEKEGYFIIPFWNVLDYLEKISQQVSIPENKKYVSELLSIIEGVTYFAKKNNSLDNYRTWWYFAKVLNNLPSDKIPNKVIDLMPIWLNSRFDTLFTGSEIVNKLLPKLLGSNVQSDLLKAEKILDYITALKAVQLSEDKKKLTEQKKEYKLLVSSYTLIDFFKKYSEEIGKKCSIKVINDLEKKIRNILTSKEDGTYQSFYEDPGYPLEEPLEVLTFICKKVLLSKSNNDIAVTKETLKRFLKGKYFYFRKMAFFIIGKSSNKYADIFWEVVSSENGESIFKNTQYWGDELKYVLRSFKNLIDGQRKMLNKKIIDAAKIYSKGNTELEYLQRQEIYQALLHDKFFKSLYKEMKKKTHTDAELHPAIGKATSGRAVGTSPLPVEEILKMKNGKIAEFVKTFKDTNFWEGPTVRALSETLGKATIEQPDKFIDDLLPFLNTAYYYVYYILDGLKEAWNSKKGIKWDKVFDFIKKYIDRNEFWQDKFIISGDSWKVDHKWIVKIVAELIEDGLKNDNWVLPQSEFNKIKEIIFLILEKIKPEKEEVVDYLTYTLNTALGGTILALMFLSIRIGKINEKANVKQTWDPEIKQKFDDLLSKGFVEPYVILGLYYRNFYLLGRDWAKGKIKEFLKIKGSEKWEAFMSGYLSNGHVYLDIYSIMRPHYKYGINFNFKKENVNKFLIQHICLGYLHGKENVGNEESLFRKIVANWNFEQINEIIGFFWMQRNYLVEKIHEETKIKETQEIIAIKNKIIDFWRWAYENKYKGQQKLKEEDQKLLSDLSKLTVFLTEIDKENYEWLKLSAKYVHKFYESPFFIEYLDKIKEKGVKEDSAKYIGEIFIAMLDDYDSLPDYDQNHIRSIVGFLYSAGNIKKADEICDIYERKLYEFLRDIYEKNNVT